MNDKRFYRILGLAMRAGGVEIGEGAVKDSIRRGSAEVVLVAGDGSENTKKKFRNSCSFYNKTYAEVADRYILGEAIGRSFAVVVAVTNAGLANQLIEMLMGE